MRSATRRGKAYDAPTSQLAPMFAYARLKARAGGGQHEVGFRHQAPPRASCHAMHLVDPGRVHGVERGHGLVQRADQLVRPALRGRR